MATEDVKMDVEEDSNKDKMEEGDAAKNGSGGQKKASNTADPPHYRVKVSGLPRFYTPFDPLLISFKELLSKLGLEVKYIRSPKKGNSWLYITFFNQANQEKALKLLKHYKWNDRTLICTLVVADVLKRKQEESGQESAKRIKLDIPLEEQMLMATIPYHAVSYEEQISKKNEEAECLFKWLTECMEKKNPQLIGYIDQEVEKNTKTKVPFELEEVRKATVVDGYRNKCEFRIAMEGETKKIVIGYRVDNQVDENIAVAPPDSLRHLPREMINLCKVFEQFVQESPYVPQVMNHDPGVWRLFHVKINKEREMLVVVLINPTVLDEKKLSELKLQLIYYFSRGAASKANGHNVVSLYIHLDTDLKVPGGGDKHKRPTPTGTMEHLWGEQHIVEQLLDLKLDIDPNFYFQNNTYGAEELYKAVLEVAEVDDQTVILDLCCGSGGMGMVFARRCKKVIGVEVLDENVNDAKRLAAKNGLTNCEFLQGAVDDLLPQLEERLKGQKVIPILDPPRIGISKKLFAMIRKFEGINRVVYITNSFKQPDRDLLALANMDKKSQFAGLDPFVIKSVAPVDTAPHSMRFDMVIVCNRVKAESLPKPKRTVPKAKKFRSNKNSRTRQRGQRGSGSSMRPNMFPTEEMVRRYSSMRKPKQEIDYQKRDSLYPVPLRGALYQGLEEEQYYPPPVEEPYNNYYQSGYGRTGHASASRYAEQVDRFADFRHGLENALDESLYVPPRNQLTSKKLAYANALLDEGIRIASEVLDGNSRPTMPSSRKSYYDRPARGRRYRY